MLKVIKYILIITGSAITIYRVTKDADLVTFGGVTIFILAFFLNSIIKAFKP